MREKVLGLPTSSYRWENWGTPWWKDSSKATHTPSLVCYDPTEVDGGSSAPIQYLTSLLDSVQRQTGRPEGSVLICVYTGTKLVWPPFLGLPIPWGLWVQLAIPEQGKRIVVYLKLTLTLGVRVYVGERAYYFRIRLHILQLTSGYLSMLHQPALLTPKSGLWEKSNCLLRVTPEPCEW